MQSADIRRTFLEFFHERGHELVPSASLVPSSYDPSVLLTTAGMQPFKPYFLGQATPDYPRATSCQKCFRTPDIDEVGTTARHLTFFEMLGNFSFGDYFKAEAVAWAWELVTGVFGIDPEHLWVTIHEGDPDLGVGRDDETAQLWRDHGVPADRIVALGKDNFWSAGPVGPCGPCSEIFYDRGPEHDGGTGETTPGGTSDRFLEFYNLVFMRYNRTEDGVLEELPRASIDTGMGLERMTSILQGGVSVFEIDSFRQIIGWAEQASGRTYGEDPVATKALRVLADHGRGMTFLTADGVLPSNEGRGYVLRRIVRRAIQQAERIGLYERGRSSALADLAGVVIEGWGDHYPELVEHQADIVRVLAIEEERFLRTLADGSQRLESILERAGGVVGGEDAFQLHDTYGFPIELTRELAAERGIEVDEAQFERLMEEQRTRAREASQGSRRVAPEAAAEFAREHPTVEFAGYDEDQVATTVTGVAAVDDIHRLVKLARSPFYPEGGGQVSDSGTISGPRGRAQVLEVMRFEDDQALLVSVDGELAAGDEVTATVDVALRRATEANHTATHLLHHALREVLGEHVHQAGSLVAPDRLRFDFTHAEPLDHAELDAIERLVNEAIVAAHPVAWATMGIDEARQAGAMMLFGEKYGDEVRMVDVGGGYSRELCGGTHVANTAEIRLFLVTAEQSVGADTRRIEAMTGSGALARLRERSQVAQRAAAELGVDVAQLPAWVQEAKSRLKVLEKELRSARSGSVFEEASAAAQEIGGGTRVVYRADGLGGDELLELADRLRSRFEPAAVVLGSALDDKVQLLASVSDELTSRVKAGEIVREIAPIVGGGGGGRPTMARAGGKDPAALAAALERARELVDGALSADLTARR